MIFCHLMRICTFSLYDCFMCSMNTLRSLFCASTTVRVILIAASATVFMSPSNLNTLLRRKKHSQILQCSKFHKVTTKTLENIKKILIPKFSNSYSSFYWAQHWMFLLLPDNTDIVSVILCSYKQNNTTHTVQQVSHLNSRMSYNLGMCYKIEEESNHQPVCGSLVLFLILLLLLLHVGQQHLQFIFPKVSSSKIGRTP